MLTLPARGGIRAPRARSRRWRFLLPLVALWAIAASVAAVRAERRAPDKSAEPHVGAATGARALRDAAGRVASLPFARLFASSDTLPSSVASMHAVVVAQLQDCNGNLSIASMLSRAAISRAVPFRAVLIEGTPADTTYLRAKLPKSLKRAAIHLLQGSERDALNAMGHYATPLLLLFDSRSRLRIVAPVSSDPVEVVAIRRAITHLATNDPLR